MTGRGFLRYVGLADAYGMGWEFVSDFAQAGPNDLSRFCRNPRFPTYPPGTYSDDTQMSLANARVLLARGCAPLDFATAWVETFLADPRLGYSRWMRETLVACRSGTDFLRRFAGNRGTGSGACMRAGVVGLMPDLERVFGVAALQASITHDSLVGILAAQVVAGAVHHAHWGLGSMTELEHFLVHRLGHWREHVDWTDPRQGLHVVARALQSVVAHTSLASLLRHCVDHGEGQDTDTIAAIAMAIAVRATEYHDDLPAVLWRDFEPGGQGEELRRMDHQLLDAFPGSTI